MAGSGTVTPTPAYYVFRHLSQYVQPGATVVGTSGGDAIAFKNTDGSVVVAMYNSGSAIDVHRRDQGAEAVVHDAGHRLGDRRRPLRWNQTAIAVPYFGAVIAVIRGRD